MSATKYTYGLSDFPNNKVNISSLSYEITNSTITIALDHIVYSSACDVWFKAELPDADFTTLSGVISSHTGEAIITQEPPTMPDGRPIVRADTRPLNTATYFTMTGDTASGIGDGPAIMWDFDPDSEFTTISGPYDLGCGGHKIPEGYKAQVIDLQFLDPIYIKDGTIYFFDSPWGQSASMSILVPAENYYPNDHGNIPSEMLGLPPGNYYSYAPHNTVYYRYVNRHYMYGSCPMGDELNAEGCQVDALPVGWIIRSVIMTPISDNKSKGFAEFEMYRYRSVILEGDTP